MAKAFACIILYVRYSSRMQREDSCEDQEREIRRYLDGLGIDHRNAVVLSDKATSGTKKSRSGYKKIEQMIRSGKEFLLVVLDLSRLSRTSGVKDLITDIRYNGGRFISVRDAVDTDRLGWQLPAGFGEVKNSLMIDGLGGRVRDGQEGRITERSSADVDGDYYGSAGDYCFGYTSEQDDPDWVYSKNNPKPKKHVVISEAEANWVKEVFNWFVVRGWSISKITRELNRLGVPKCRRSSKLGWHHHMVRRLLGNSKYAGVWIWGKTKSIRNSSGKVKQEPVPEDEWVTELRPGLRIVDEETWEKALKRLAELEKVYGQKPGQKPRGPRVHHTAVYPSSLLGGLLSCGKCGARLVYQTAPADVYYGCPNHRKGVCTQATRAPREKTEGALLDFLHGEFRGVPTWMDEVMSCLHTHLKELDVSVPREVEAKTKARDEIKRKIGNITEAIEQGGTRSAHLTDRLAEHEAEVARLQSEIEQAEELLNIPSELPPKAWIKERMADLADVLRGNVRQAALLLRDIVGKITVHSIIPPGKRRGFPRLKFTIDAWAVASRVLKKARGFPAAALTMPQDCDFSNQEVVLDIGGPSRTDTWGPKIMQMREEGVPWNEIGRISGLGSGNAWTAFRRYTDAMKARNRPTGNARGKAPSG